MEQQPAVPQDAKTKCHLPRNLKQKDAFNTFNFLMTWNSLGTFILYAAVNALSILFVIKIVPETKGRTLEQSIDSYHQPPSIQPERHLFSRFKHPCSSNEVGPNYHSSFLSPTDFT